MAINATRCRLRPVSTTALLTYSAGLNPTIRFQVRHRSHRQMSSKGVQLLTMLKGQLSSTPRTIQLIHPHSFVPSLVVCRTPILTILINTPRTARTCFPAPGSNIHPISCRILSILQSGPFQQGPFFLPIPPTTLMETDQPECTILTIATSSTTTVLLLHNIRSWHSFQGFRYN